MPGAQKIAVPKTACMNARPRMTARVKICGIRDGEALDAALEAGADLVGLVMFPKSPRNVTLEEATALASRARRAGQDVKVVVLLVDPDDALVAAVAKAVSPDLIQLHGHETPERVRAIRRLSGRPVLKAVAVASKTGVEGALAYLEPEGAGADMLLFDAKPPAGPAALPGGNGLVFDWRILEAMKGRIPFALAGGLTPENVAAAIALTGADIVDVSSGVERKPGEKDPERIRRFLQAAKAAKEA